MLVGLGRRPCFCLVRNHEASCRCRELETEHCDPGSGMSAGDHSAKVWRQKVDPYEAIAFTWHQMASHGIIFVGEIHVLANVVAKEMGQR